MDTSDRVTDRSFKFLLVGRLPYLYEIMLCRRVIMGGGEGGAVITFLKLYPDCKSIKSINRFRGMTMGLYRKRTGKKITTIRETAHLFPVVYEVVRRYFTTRIEQFNAI